MHVSKHLYTSYFTQINLNDMTKLKNQSSQRNSQIYSQNATRFSTPPSGE